LGIFGLYVLMATSVGKLGSGTKNPPSFKRGSVNKSKGKVPLSPTSMLL
jgi:hypothetical protein